MVELIPAVHIPCLTPCWAISARWSSRKIFTFLGDRNWEAAVWCNESWARLPLIPMLVLQLAPTEKSTPTSPPFQGCLPVSFFVQHSCFWRVNFLQVSFLNWVTAGPGKNQCWHQESGRNSHPGRRRRTRSGWLPFCSDCHQLSLSWSHADTRGTWELGALALFLQGKYRSSWGKLGSAGPKTILSLTELHVTTDWTV